MVRYRTWRAALLLCTLIGIVSSATGQTMQEFLDSLPRDQEIVYTSLKGYLAQKSEFDSFENDVRNNAVMAYVRSCYYTSRLDEGLTYVKRWDDYTDSIGYSDGKERILSMIAGGHHFKAEPDSAIFYWAKAAEYAKENKNLKEVADLQNNIGVVYMDRGLHEQAINWFRKSVSAKLQLGNSKTLATSYSNMAETFMELGQLDSSRYYAEQGLSLAKESGDSRIVITLSRALAGYYANVSNKEKAKELYLEVARLAREQGIDRDYHSAILNLSSLEEDRTKALEYADATTAYWMLKENSFAGAYGVLMDTYSKYGQHKKAYDVAKVGYQRTDSLSRANMESRITELSTQFDLSEKERIIALKKQELAVSNLETNRLYSFLFCLLALLGGLGMVLYFRNRIKENKQRLKDEEFNTRLAQLETMVLKSQMNPHFIFNSLNSIRYLFMKDHKDQGLMYITKFAKLLRTTLNHGDQALVKLCDEVELTELYISLESLRFDSGVDYQSSKPSDQVWPSVLIPPFTIQPIVENAFWHGLSDTSIKEKKLVLTIRQTANMTTVTIDDSGVGFGNGKQSTDEEVSKSKSYGLGLIKERFDLMNATQDITYALSVGDTDKFTTGSSVAITITSKS